MVNTEIFIQQTATAAVEKLYGPLSQPLQVSKTRKEFKGDYTLVVFPLLKISHKSPDVTASEIGDQIMSMTSEVAGFNVVKGFLNIELSKSYWLGILNEIIADANYGFLKPTGRKVMVEYSSPNTNKPLHLGHVRNNLLGYSVAKILEANGAEVLKMNLVNDRGIHICKSMLAWQLFGNGETPESSGKKGDHLVGDYYVRFDKEYREQVAQLVAGGMAEDEAKNRAPIMEQAHEMLVKWEAKDPEVYQLWQKMNGWVFAGFDETYKKMGVSFDRTYYESQTYLLGKRIVEEGLQKGVLYRRDDGSVWIDLREDGLDEKLLLRKDGTSVYMTQDLGTAMQRYEEYRFEDMTYVVGNEQNYHFQVLKLVLKKLGYEWSDVIYHLSYGMVELPNGKMKSREGTVVDADDLIDAMVDEAKAMSSELGKLDGLNEAEASDICRMIGLGALKYFILKVDPKKNMLFNPEESIDFNGNTGPFIQYTYARICSLRRKAEENRISGLLPGGYEMEDKEVEIVKMLADFAGAVREAGTNHSPSVIASYVYELSKEFNQYYHDHPILKGDVAAEDKSFRLALSLETANIIRRAMGLLGIEVPERM